MSRNNTAAFGIYSDRASAERAVDALRAANYKPTDISILFPRRHPQDETKTGAGAGAVVGGTLGWLAGIGALILPGLGPLIAAGPLIATLAGAGVGGTLGGLVGGLVGMGIPEHEARRFEGHVKRGNILLSVHGDSPEATTRARQILEETGAEDVSSTSEAA